MAKKGYIYNICFLSTNKNYVGSTNNFNRRKSEHIHHLKKNNHFNKYIQNLYNKYGIDDVIFSILEEVDIISNYSDILLEKEYYYICKSINNINLALPTRNRKISYVRNDIHKERARILSRKAQPLAAKARIGSKHSLKTKIKISRSMGGKSIGMYSIEGELERVFQNTSEVCLLMNIKSSNLRNNLYNITNTCCGKVFKFLNNNGILDR